jgi:glycosyltransferase involved in cell wall biosynthesis
MKIVYLAAGAGGMYCGACLHASTLAGAIRKAGEDILLAPVYTPLKMDEDVATTDLVAFGGINVYLQQRSALFRHTPWFLDRLLDLPSLLRRATRRSSSVRPESLGALCVSMLKGEEGRQRKEVEKLIRWLEETGPDVVHLSTALLAGMARPIRRRLGVPVVATLTGEDGFLDRLPEPHRSEARRVFRDRAGDLAALVALSKDYADYMAAYSGLPRERFHVIPPGLNLATIDEDLRQAGPRPTRRPGDPATIGFLSRICEEKGLHLLAEAFIALAKDAQMLPLRLRVAGYLSEADRPYLDGVREQLARAGLADRFEYAGEVDRSGKIAFLNGLDVMCLPAIARESKGLPVLEAWACGVPVVVAGHGILAEFVADAGGGLVHPPQDVSGLAAALKRLILDADLAAEYRKRGRAAIEDRYHAGLMAQRTIALYRGVAKAAAS